MREKQPTKYGTLFHVFRAQESTSLTLQLRPRLPSQSNDVWQQPPHQRSSRVLTTLVYPHEHTVTGNFSAPVPCSNQQPPGAAYCAPSTRSPRGSLSLPTVHTNDSFGSLRTRAKRGTARPNVQLQNISPRTHLQDEQNTFPRKALALTLNHSTRHRGVSATLLHSFSSGRLATSFAVAGMALGPVGPNDPQEQQGEFVWRARHAVVIVDFVFHDPLR